MAGRLEGDALKVHVDAYRVPHELNALLHRWGRNVEGRPRLGYRNISPCVGEYRAPGYQTERIGYDVAYYDRLCWVIDNLLSDPHREMLWKYYRDGWKKRKCARYFRVTVEVYEDHFKALIERIERLLDE